MTHLALLSNLARDRRDLAAKKLGRAFALLKESESRLGLLEQYCVDYRARLAQSATRGVSPDELRNFREFITRLEQAIDQQAREVGALRKGAAVCRDGWLVERRANRSFEVLVERRDIEKREDEARRLQKLVDEFAGRAASLRAAP